MSPRIALAVAALGGAAAVLSILSAHWLLAIVAAATAAVGLLAWRRPPAPGGGISPLSDHPPARERYTPDR